MLSVRNLYEYMHASTVCNCSLTAPEYIRVKSKNRSTPRSALNAKIWTCRQYIESAVFFRSWHVATTEVLTARLVSITSFDELEISWSTSMLQVAGCLGNVRLAWDRCYIYMHARMPTKQSIHTHATSKFLYKRHMQTCLAFGFSQSARSNSSKVHTRWWFLKTLATRSLKSEVYCLLASVRHLPPHAHLSGASPSQAAATIYPVWRDPCTLLGMPSWWLSEKLANQIAHLPEDLWETHTVMSSTVVCKAERDAQQRPWSCGQHQQNALHLLGAGSIPESDVLRQHKSRQLMPASKWRRKV